MSAPPAPRRRPSPYGAAIGRDDRLLTALSEGGQALGGDPVAALLSAWRREVGRAGDRALRRPAPPDPVGMAAGPPRRLRMGPPAGRWRGSTLMVAAAAVAACAALGLGALHARPAEPLWRLTEVV